MRSLKSLTSVIEQNRPGGISLVAALLGFLLGTRLPAAGTVMLQAVSVALAAALLVLAVMLDKRAQTHLNDGVLSRAAWLLAAAASLGWLAGAALSIDLR